MTFKFGSYLSETSQKKRKEEGNVNNMNKKYAEFGL